ncbi:MAG: pilus (MSHA type) biogenesis protein MshL [Proteobacteria bacterium ST_bin11]|nr:MAG: pilus (MSHA type) biogenesis protein MshL [Proteobacteria bacterium ST_bin11]
MLNTFVIVTASLTLLVSACSETAAIKTANVDKTFPTPVSPTTPTSPTPPAAVTDALIPDFNQTLLGDSWSARPMTFNVSVHEVDAREFFMSLVVDSQENMVVHPDVTGRISLELKNVSIPQVLSAVQKVYGYDYSKTDIGYIIYPATLQTKIFKIDHIDLLREGSSNTRVSSGQISNNSRRNNANNQNIDTSNLGNNNPNGNSNSNSNSNSTSGSWITTSSKTDFWEELQLSLSAIVQVDTPAAGNAESNELINPKTGSKVVINKQTGIVVVRANPTQMREVEKLVASTQGQIGRQVVIEAKILEIILDDKHQDGVNWANIVREGSRAFLTASNPLPSIVAGTTEVFTLGIRSGDFYAFIELMEGQGKTNILSSPRISTLNNQKAVIKVGEDEYFITDIASNNSLSAATNTVTQDITWTPFFSGIALDVTPQISDNNNITLHIHPSITRGRQDDKKFSINGDDNSLPMARNTVRESDSIVHAENGQIIVIGGLMQENREENKQGVSLLSRIPYLGNAFRENQGTGLKSELVILLKPTIISNGQDWNAPIEDSRERMQQLERKQLWK